MNDANEDATDHSIKDAIENTNKNAIKVVLISVAHALIFLENFLMRCDH